MIGSVRVGRLRPMVRRLESGQVVVLLAVLMPLLAALLGLAGDGGLVLTDRRTLQNAADGAARAGASHIDQGTYRVSSGKTVALDPAKAREVAAAYVASEYPGTAAVIDADQRQVVVQVTQDMPTSFLRIAHINSVHVSATSVAQPRYGITQADAG